MKFFKKRTSVRELEERVNALEKKIFNKVEKRSGFYLWTWNPLDRYEVKTLEEEINDAHEKIDLLAKKLGIKLMIVGEKGEHWVMRKVTKKKGGK